MLTYDEALAKAKAVKSRINYCVEYTNAYSFGYRIGENEGGDASVVIMKDDGRVVNLLDYALTPDKEFVREFNIEQQNDYKKRNPKDINKKLHSLTKEQANGLADSLNSVYVGEKPADKPKATMFNVSRFDDDGFGIRNITMPCDKYDEYKENGPDGVDRWTSNGHGLTMGDPVLTPEQAAEIDNATEKD